MRTLSLRELNRATLDRQLLLRRVDVPVVDAIEQVLGLQAQAPVPPFVGLWTRLHGFHESALQAVLDERAVVRATMMRHTIHFVTARDYAWLRPTIQPALDANYSGVTRKRLDGFDIEPFLELARELFHEPRTFAELQAAIEERAPGSDVRALAYAARTFLRLNGVPNGSRWRFGGRAPFVHAEKWLGRRLPPDGDPPRMVRRYLAAFGPAAVADITAWSGVGGVRAVVDGMRDELVTYRDESGRELLDLPDAPLPGADVEAPVRFLPEFDNTLLAHRDRTRVIAEEHRPRLYIGAARMAGTVMLDGFAAAVWRAERKKAEAAVQIEPFRRITKRERAAIEPEADALLAFLEPDASSRSVRYADTAPGSGR